MKVQLCDVLESNVDIEPGEWIIQPKYDGLRCFFFFRHGKYEKVLSRNGKPLYNIDYIGWEIEHKNPGLNCVLDGEILGKDWNETSSIVKASKTIKFSENIYYHAFDAIHINEFEQEKETHVKLIDRMLSLDKMQKTEHFKITQSQLLYSTTDAWEKMAVYMKAGYEGAVIKRIHSVYKYKRSKDWLKLKITHTHDIKIIEVIEGEGKYKNMLGALNCLTKDSHPVSIGSGFIDKERTELWDNRDKLIGKMIEVKAQEVTKEGSLRFPIFIRFREDLV